jgi:hypothetical protein
MHAAPDDEQREIRPLDRENPRLNVLAARWPLWWTDQMLLLDVESAVAEIVRGAKPAPQAHPWFLMVGAGISVPHVPHAWGIVELCRARLRAREVDVDALTSPPGEEYAFWLEQYGDAHQRQALFQSLIRGTRISHTNFRLAHLLESGVLGRLLLTTNFDDFVSRALRLLGHEHIVCDHPATISRIVHDREDIQLVHIHGSYWFYDACHLRRELAERAQELAAFMRDLLDRRSPILFGYSGQERGDAFMTALAHRLAGPPLSAPIYWFCYRRDEAARIATILGTDTDQIRYVVPAHHHGRLDARDATDKLLRGFGVAPPAFLTEPLEFIARSLSSSLPPTELGGADAYQDQLVLLVERFREAAERDRSARGEAGEHIARIRQAALDQRWPAARELAIQLDPAQLSGVLRKEAALALTRIGLNDPSAGSIEILDRALSAALFVGFGSDEHLPGLIALASCRRAQLLQEHGQPECWWTRESAEICDGCKRRRGAMSGRLGRDSAVRRPSWPGAPACRSRPRAGGSCRPRWR